MEWATQRFELRPDLPLCSRARVVALGLEQRWSLGSWRRSAQVALPAGDAVSLTGHVLRMLFRLALA